jgi:hypothetical protein
MVHGRRCLSRQCRAIAAIGGLVLAVSSGRVARAQDVAGTASSAPAEDVVKLDEHTALMVGRHNLKLGLLTFEYGVTRNFSVGLDAPYYVTKALTPVFAPNLHAKLAVVDRPTLVVSGLVAGFSIWIKDKGTTGNLLVIPGSVFGSVLVAPRFWLHGELNYNWAHSIGDGTVNDHQVKGAVATRTGQVGLVAEYHFTRVVAAVARGRYQVFTTPVVVKGTSTLDEFTQAELAAELRPAHAHPWMAVGGMLFTWKHVGLLLAAGYGNVFAPGSNIALPYTGVVPDASLWVTF